MKISPLSILLAGTFLSTSAVAITLEPTLDDSFISYSEGTASDYNFTVQEADADGNLTTKYYKINIDEDKLSTSSSISWSEVDEAKKDESNVVEVQLPNNQSKYFKYTYTVPSGYETITESENISVVNPADSETHKYVGAAINNASGNDYGDINEKVFINNKVTAYLDHRGSGARGLYVYGGAISNQGTIGSIVADFIGNSIEITSRGSWLESIYAYGGAIYNSGTIGNITGDFIGNYAKGTLAYGGAIYNDGTINSIYGSFIGNHVIYEGDSAFGSNSYGGAIYNSGEITNIVADFIGNYGLNLDYSYLVGGAIENIGTIGNIDGNFIGNYISLSNTGTGEGGAIFNSGTIGDITGDFIGNYANSLSAADGGAIYNNGVIGNITGDFIGNYAIGDYRVEGGAIYTRITGTIGATIGNITGDFIGNYAKSISEIAYGGAIYGDGNAWSSIGNITGDFIGNYAEASHNAEGGAIFNGRKIGNITGNFIGNYAKSISKSAYGGAISNSFAIIGDITGNFIDNYTSSSLSYGSGGAIENSCGTIGHIIGNFINNYSTRAGGAIANSEGYIEGITGNFIKNRITTSSDAYGGAIYVSSADATGTIGNIVGNFINNYVYSSDGYATGGAISNSTGKIDNITGNFTENYAYGYNEALGGAIYNMDYDWQETGVGIDVISGSFVDNYVQAEGYAYGGAIFHEGGDLTFTSKGKDYKISGNYTQDSRGKINNAIWMQNRKYHGPELPANIDTNSINISLMDNSNYEPLIPSLNFNITKNGSYTIDDQIDGGYYYGMQEYNSEPSEPVDRYGYGYNLNISGDACTQCEWNSVKFNNLVNNVNNLTVTKSQMALGKDAVVNVVNNYIAKSNPYLRLDLDAVNKKVGQLNIGGNLEGTTSVIVNVLKNKETTEKNSIVFATAQNHSLSEEDAKKSFEVYRVVGSPYMWAISYNDINKTWGLYSTSDVNDYTEDCTKPETPEVFDGFMPTLDRIKEGTQIVDYISDVEVLPNSAFAYQEATSGDNSFSFTDTNAYGLETDKAYKIVLKPEEFSTSSDLTFKADNNGPIEVQLPNGETQYFSYEYTGDESDAAIGYN